MEKSSRRISGIELLKVIAILLIVLSHVTQSVGSVRGLDGMKIVDVSMASNNIQYIILSFFQYFGALGNNIFLICSVWFLCDSDRTSLQKIIQMLLDVWVLSVLNLAGFMCAGADISSHDMIKALLPTTFSCNWYITCYILLYAIHPLLNVVVKNVSRHALKVFSVTAFVIYFGICFVDSELFFSNELVLFIVIYIIVASLKRYASDKLDSPKVTRLLLLIGFIGYLGIGLMLEVIGLRIGAFSDKVLMFCKLQNPFLLFIAMGLFNVFRGMKFVSPVINKLSSLTLIIYVTHENLFVREILRPHIMNMIYERFGFGMLLCEVLVFAVGLFAATIVVGLIYSYTLQRITKNISKKASNRLHICVKSENH